jgi:protein-L-isoaspartate O-methyltransferase
VTDSDYVLGTHDSEIERLALQHLVWRPAMLETWRRAGITSGSRVLDVGAGPGFASADLGEIVGPNGEVIAVERSERFANAARAHCARKCLTNVRVVDSDLMEGAIPASGIDVAWCRWVACFVVSPKTLVEKIARALKPGGTAIFHEYGNYASWQVLPPRASFNAFVAEVMASWRDAGGEPDIGLTLPSLMRASGFDVVDVRPIIFATGPADFIWQWPATFLRSGVRRLEELGRVDSKWAETLLRDFDEVERDRDSVMLTPMVLEIAGSTRRNNRGSCNNGTYQ